MLFKSFDITFKIVEFNLDKDLLVVQFHSSILKNPMGTYPEINLSTKIINFEENVEEQIIRQCRGLILEVYEKENKNKISEKIGVTYLEENLQKIITVENYDYVLNEKTIENKPLNRPSTKINFL
jgi:hypothetical protein